MKVSLLTPLLLPLALFAADARVPVADFSRGDLNGWQEKRFAGRTDYRLVRDGQQTALRADSQAAASGRFKEIQVDLSTTPVLHWSWKIDHPLAGLDERSKAGDDYPARIYVVFSGGLLFWRTRAINYVWSSGQPVGSRWPNAYTDHARMIAVESGPEKRGRWLQEQRNVAADYRQLFGADPGPVDAVAIMTDTDNSGQQATAWYGDIWFSSE